MTKTIDFEIVFTSRVKRGDVDAFREVYSRHWRNIYTIALSFLKSKQDAEDAVQEIFIRFWNKREYLSDDLSYRPYLFKMAKNSLVNILKYSSLRMSYDLEECALSGVRVTDETVEYNELASCAHEAIDKLPPKRKNAFNLRRKEGLTNKEIAHEMGISVKMVEKQLKLSNSFIRHYLSVNIGTKAMSIALFISFFS
jgi:RNA polymerase sigma-70 factor (family 1)